MTNVSNIASNIQRDQVKVDELSGHIKGLYASINDGLAASNGVITKEIDSLYKEIDSTFGKKVKLEQSIHAAKRQIFIELGV